MKLSESTVKAIRCGPVPKVRDWRKLAVSKLTRAEKAMAFVERYLRVPEGALTGQFIKLENFQQAFFYSVFDNPNGTRRAYLSIARKNAKTALIACLLIVFIAGPEAVLNSRLYSGAMSKDQAAEVYNYASKMINLSPELSARCKTIPSRKMIIGLSRNVEYAAISAEGKTAHGKSPLIAILDEVGQIKGPQSDFVDAIITAQGAYENPMLFAISTQASNDNDLFSIWLDDAEKSKDDRIVSHLYCADKEAKVLDKKAWYDSNPALGKFRSLKDLSEQADRADRMPSFESTFRNLALNQRVDTTSPFVSKGVWLANGGAIDESVFENNKIYVGLDLSARNDLTAMAISAFDGQYWHVKTMFWTPAKGLNDRAKRDRAPYDTWEKEGYIRAIQGASIDYAMLAQEIAEALEGLDVEAIAFDRWRIDLLKKEFEKLSIDLPLVEFGQGFKDMAPALDNLETLLLNEKIKHGNNPVLTMCIANSRVVKDASNNRKLDKMKAAGRIDGAVALVMALSATKQEEEQGDFAGFLSNPILI